MSVNFIDNKKLLETSIKNKNSAIFKLIFEFLIPYYQHLLLEPDNHIESKDANQPIFLLKTLIESDPKLTKLLISHLLNNYLINFFKILVNSTDTLISFLIKNLSYEILI
ncbi:MAG: hypothetical protein JWM09_176 [Francisellaceae bacterium]|nr:hypothetical protein [Francisellaceae bacterium]